MTISASIGIVSGTYSSAEDLLNGRRRGALRGHEAVAGLNRAMRFEPHMRGEFRTRIDLERDLRLALEAGEFFLVYQPVVQLSDGTVQSMEALLRWRRPSGLVVGPDAFIPALEESGLIVGTLWCLRAARGVPTSDASVGTTRDCRRRFR